MYAFMCVYVCMDVEQTIGWKHMLWNGVDTKTIRIYVYMYVSEKREHEQGRTRVPVCFNL